jgi:hypothetical protein
MNFNDGYGQWLSRSNVCYNNYASVVVMVTDTCACHYPNNYHSNKRWCCMDMYHLDMSVWAYEKVGVSDLQQGTIKGQCSHHTVAALPLVMHPLVARAAALLWLRLCTCAQ